MCAEAWISAVGGNWRVSCDSDFMLSGVASDIFLMLRRFLCYKLFLSKKICVDNLE